MKILFCMMSGEDTIAAISTPAGRGGIGIVRVSGTDALMIALRIFRSPQLSGTIEERKLHFGRVVDRHNRILDHGYLIYFRSPESFTGEDTVELSCHGSPFVLKSILEEITHAGARVAEPGEFTMRAFLNGRIDLIQAEAIRDLIESRTYYQAKVAFDQIEGELSQRLIPIKEMLVNTLAEGEASLDFPDENEKFISLKEMGQAAGFISLKIKELIESFKEGRVIKEGGCVTLVGSPNVGKSSIFNQLLKYDRAIVTDEPGTTRDTVEEMLDIDGIPVRFIDTAGLREAKDIIEHEGVRRSEHAMRRADLILYVIDSSRDMNEEEVEFFSRVPPEKTIVVKNKIDLQRMLKENSMPERFGQRIEVSAKNGIGIVALNRMIRDSLSSMSEDSLTECIVTNVRHAELLKKVQESLQNARDSLRSSVSEEYMLLDLKKALHFINELTGETTMDDIYDRIFSKFCLGK